MAIPKLNATFPLAGEYLSRHRITVPQGDIRDGAREIIYEHDKCSAAAVYYSIEVMWGEKGMTQALWGRLDGFIGGSPSFAWIINRLQGETEMLQVMLMDFSFVLLREMKNW